MMTDKQAEGIVLAWCRRDRSDGAKPVMRSSGAESVVLDASYFGLHEMARGLDWIEVCAALGCYGPQWEPVPVKRAEPPPHYGYRHRPISRRYGRR